MKNRKTSKEETEQKGLKMKGHAHLLKEDKHL